MDQIDEILNQLTPAAQINKQGRIIAMRIDGLPEAKKQLEILISVLMREAQ